MTLLLGSAIKAEAATADALVVNGKSLPAHTETRIYSNTTYVSLRAVTEALQPDAKVAWDKGRAVVEAEDLFLEAKPGELYITVNGRVLFVPKGVLLERGRTMVPVRVLAQALGAGVHWDAATGKVTVTENGRPIQTGEQFYDQDELFWLSRIISAESRGETMWGQIAVGNVVLNRVDHVDFPNTIYGVIFDDRWGGQFEPVRNGTIYQEPTSDSVTAAKLTLEGADVAGDSLYFLAPSLTNDHWIMENRVLRMIIGTHWFYR